MSGAERIGPRTTRLGVIWRRGEPCLNLQASDVTLSQRSTHTRRTTSSPGKELKKNFFFSPHVLATSPTDVFFSPSCANNDDLPFRALFPNVWAQRTVLHRATHWLLQWAVSNQPALTVAVTMPSREERTAAVQAGTKPPCLGPSGHCFHWHVQMWHRAVQLTAPLGLPSLQPGRDCHPHRPGFRRGDRYRDTCGDCCASAFSSQIFPVCGLIYLGCACMGCSWASSHCLEKSQLRYSGQIDAVWGGGAGVTRGLLTTAHQARPPGAVYGQGAECRHCRGDVLEVLDIVPSAVPVLGSNVVPQAFSIISCFLGGRETAPASKL